MISDLVKTYGSVGSIEAAAGLAADTIQIADVAGRLALADATKLAAYLGVPILTVAIYAGRVFGDGTHKTLAALLASRGLVKSQEVSAFAAQLGVSAPLFANVDDRRQPLPLDVVRAMALHLRCDVWEVRSATRMVTMAPASRRTLTPLPPRPLKTLAELQPPLPELAPVSPLAAAVAAFGSAFTT